MEAERCERISHSRIEFAHKLNPIKTKINSLKILKQGTKSYQCNRSVCKKADKPSIITRIPTVSTDQTIKSITTNGTLKYPKAILNPRRKICCQTISANSEIIFHIVIATWILDESMLRVLRACAKDNAHNRRYEAVCEIVFNTYSIVWIACCINTSLISSLSCSP